MKLLISGLILLFSHLTLAQSDVPGFGIELKNLKTGIVSTERDLCTSRTGGFLKGECEFQIDSILSVKVSYQMTEEDDQTTPSYDPTYEFKTVLYTTATNEVHAEEATNAKFPNCEDERIYFQRMFKDASGEFKLLKTGCWFN